MVEGAEGHGSANVLAYRHEGNTQHGNGPVKSHLTLFFFLLVTAVLE
jgi:hypothetical protein